MTDIIPIVSSKKTYEETWQLKVSKIDDRKLWRKFFDYKCKRNLTTSKALRELLNFAFLCLKNGFITDPNDPKSLIRQGSVDTWSRSTRIKEYPIENQPDDDIIPENDYVFYSIIKPIESKISLATKKMLYKAKKEKGEGFITCIIEYVLTNVKSNFDRYLQDHIFTNWAQALYHSRTKNDNKPLKKYAAD